MDLIIILPSLIIFLYTLYKLCKDDHVFLRRNVRSEHFFDIAFIALAACWVLYKLIYSLNPGILVFTLTGAVSLFSLGKYKKIPIGRLFDFFSLSFLSSLPLWYLIRGILDKGNDRFVEIFFAIIYLATAAFFIKKLLPRLMSRNIKEGIISTYFIIFISLSSISLFIYKFITINARIFTLENIISVTLLIITTILLIGTRK